MDETGFLAAALGKLFGTNFFKFVSATLIAFIGVLVKHYMGFKSRHHAFWSIDLIFGVVIAMLMGVVGSGAAEQMALGPNATTGLIATLGYIGPKGLGRLWEIVIEKLEQKGRI